MEIANLILLGAGAYLAVGFLFGLAFVTLGVQRVDHAAKEAPWSFRLLILPGAAALWPFLLRRWIAAGKEPTP